MRLTTRALVWLRLFPFGIAGIGVDAEEAVGFAFDGGADGVAADGVEVELSADGAVGTLLH
ncbi:MAG: hypothetical protein ACE367_25980 [Acidimicrobiales bacterium]